MNVQIIILAGGRGKRMKSDLPKVLHPIKGQPMISHLLNSIRESGVCSQPVIVVGHQAELVQQALGNQYTYVVQAEQLGTGHAVKTAQGVVKGTADHVLVLFGDKPYISPDTIRRLVNEHQQSGCAMSMTTAIVPDFDDWRRTLRDHGRIVRDTAGNVTKAVTHRDASAAELNILEIDTGTYCFQSAWLWQNIGKLGCNNAQHEYYLPDLLELAISQGLKICTVTDDPRAGLGVNSIDHLLALESL